MPDLARRLAVARGDELADVVIEGGKVFSAFTREWLETEVAICDGYVAGLGEYAGKEVIHAGGVGGDPDELAKLALNGISHVDGHAPSLLGRGVQAYAAAGVRSDHE